MPSGRGLGEDRGGSSAVEHAIVLSLVALSALGAFVALGDEMGLEVDCTASTIRGGGTPCRGSRGARGALGALGGTPTPSPETGSRRPSGATQAALTARSAGGEGDDATRAASGAISTTPATPARVQGVTESTPARESIGPAVGSTAPPPPSDPYAMEVHVLVVDAIAHFRQLAGEDDEITRAELERLSRGPGAVGELARELLRHRSLLRALDIGAGRGEVDGKISQADVDETLLRVQRREDLYDLLADSASGRGGRDEEVSRADLLALADDPSVPASLRARARREAASMPEDGDGCSWYRVDCHAVRIAKHVYHHPRAIPSFVGAFELGIERGVVNALKTTVTGTYQMAHEAAAYAVAHPMRALLLPQRLMLDPYFRARVLEIVGRQTLRGTVAYARATGHRIATCDTGVECGEAIGVPLGEIGWAWLLAKAPVSSGAARGSCPRRPRCSSAHIERRDRPLAPALGPPTEERASRRRRPDPTTRSSRRRSSTSNSSRASAASALCTQRPRDTRTSASTAAPLGSLRRAGRGAG